MSGTSTTIGLHQPETKIGTRETKNMEEISILVTESGLVHD